MFFTMIGVLIFVLNVFSIDRDTCIAISNKLNNVNKYIISKEYIEI